MWTKERVLAECVKLSSLTGDTFDIPILINRRFSKTLGRVTIKINELQIWVPTLMEISESLLETGTDADIVSVIQHEWCHYMVTKRTGESHGHDAKFKAMCAAIGCANDGVSTRLESDKEEDEPRYKYSVICNTCKKEVGGYTRMCPTLRNIQDCYCKTCGKFNLTYVQNW